MIISDVTFFVIHGLMAIFETRWESEEIIGAQLEEWSGHMLNEDKIKALAMIEPTDTIIKLV